MAQPRRPMPVLDFDHIEYAARVSVARLPTYSEPYPNGVPLPDRHYGGGRRIVLVQGWVSPDGEYLSARTKANEWIVVWSLKDWEGRPVGVNFCDIEAELPLPQLPCSQSTIEDKPDMPPNWPPGRTLTEQARWAIKNYPGNDPTIVGNVDPPYMLSADLFYKICSIEE